MKDREYWIIFCQGHMWFSSLMKKNFSHCFLLSRDEFNWYRVDFTEKSMFVKILAARASNDLVPYYYLNKFTRQGLYIRCNPKHQRPYIPLGLMNCIGMIKKFIGYQSFCLTPYQLYKNLVTMNHLKRAKHGISLIKAL